MTSKAKIKYGLKDAYRDIVTLEAKVEELGDGGSGGFSAEALAQIEDNRVNIAGLHGLVNPNTVSSLFPDLAGFGDIAGYITGFELIGDRYYALVSFGGLYSLGTVDAPQFEKLTPDVTTHGNFFTMVKTDTHLMFFHRELCYRFTISEDSTLVLDDANGVPVHDGNKLSGDVRSSVADGDTVIVSTEYGYIYKSTDSGATWVNKYNAEINYGTGGYLASDGATVVLPISHRFFDSAFVTSIDFGETWIESVISGCRDVVFRGIGLSGNAVLLGLELGDYWGIEEENYCLYSASLGGSWSKIDLPSFIAEGNLRTIAVVDRGVIPRFALFPSLPNDGNQTTHCEFFDGEIYAVAKAFPFEVHMTKFINGDLCLGTMPPDIYRSEVVSIIPWLEEQALDNKAGIEKINGAIESSSTSITEITKDLYTNPTTFTVDIHSRNKADYAGITHVQERFITVDMKNVYRISSDYGVTWVECASPKPGLKTFKEPIGCQDNLFIFCNTKGDIDYTMYRCTVSATAITVVDEVPLPRLTAGGYPLVASSGLKIILTSSGSNRNSLTSVDGGVQWNESVAGGDIIAVSCSEDRFCYIVKDVDNYIVAVSEDGGTWTTTTFNSTVTDGGDIFNVQTVLITNSAQNQIMVGGDYEPEGVSGLRLPGYNLSTDGGETWSFVKLSGYDFSRGADIRKILPYGDNEFFFLTSDATDHPVYAGSHELGIRKTEVDGIWEPGYFRYMDAIDNNVVCLADLHSLKNVPFSKVEKTIDELDSLLTVVEQSNILYEKNFSQLKVDLSTTQSNIVSVEFNGNIDQNLWPTFNYGYDATNLSPVTAMGSNDAFIFIYTESNEIYRSANGGETWKRVAKLNLGDADNMQFLLVTDTHVYAFRRRHYNRWNIKADGLYSEWVDAVEDGLPSDFWHTSGMIFNGKAVVAGNNGCIYTNDYGASSWIKESPSELVGYAPSAMTPIDEDSFMITALGAEDSLNDDGAIFIKSSNNITVIPGLVVGGKSLIVRPYGSAVWNNGEQLAVCGKLQYIIPEDEQEDIWAVTMGAVVVSLDMGATWTVVYDKQPDPFIHTVTCVEYGASGDLFFNLQYKPNLFKLEPSNNWALSKITTTSVETHEDRQGVRDSCVFDENIYFGLASGEIVANKNRNRIDGLNSDITNLHTFIKTNNDAIDDLEEIITSEFIEEIDENAQINVRQEGDIEAIKKDIELLKKIHAPKPPLEFKNLNSPTGGDIIVHMAAHGDLIVITTETHVYYTSNHGTTWTSDPISALYLTEVKYLVTGKTGIYAGGSGSNGKDTLVKCEQLSDSYGWPTALGYGVTFIDDAKVSVSAAGDLMFYNGGYYFTSMVELLHTGVWADLTNKLMKNSRPKPVRINNKVIVGSDCPAYGSDHFFSLQDGESTWEPYLGCEEIGGGAEAKFGYKGGLLASSASGIFYTTSGDKWDIIPTEFNVPGEYLTFDKVAGGEHAVVISKDEKSLYSVDIGINWFEFNPLSAVDKNNNHVWKEVFTNNVVLVTSTTGDLVYSTYGFEEQAGAKPLNSIAFESMDGTAKAEITFDADNRIILRMGANTTILMDSSGRLITAGGLGDMAD